MSKNKKEKEGNPTLFDRTIDGWINSFISTSTLSVFLLISIIGNGIQFFLLTTKFDNEKIALVPPVINDTVHLRTGEVTEGFYREMALKVASLYGTFTPSTIDANVALFLDYVTPQFYARASKDLAISKEKVKQNMISQFFGIRDIKTKGPWAYIRGNIKRFSSNGTLISNAEDALMVVKFAYSPSLKRVFIDDVKLYESYEKWRKMYTSSATNKVGG